jgi:cellulose synthase/poly-beta-1,6-N-acetylglucosamine synthase-like glycosyltransferase
MLIFLDIFVLVGTGFLALYLAMLSVAGLARGYSRLSSSSTFHRLAVIVPAHNEETGIARTLSSIFHVQYPGLWYDVIVIADNCTDRTAEIARDLGATVHERRSDQHSKGYALEWCFARLLDRQPLYDAFIVIDADTIVNTTFLDVMNTYLANGARVIQCTDVVEPQPGAWSSEITRLSFLLYNVARPLGRRAVHCSAGLRGNGMCFHREILKSIPWRAYSKAEDLEYSLTLITHNQRVTFAPEAVVVATMPRNPENAESQRARWETGRFPLVRAYAAKLLAAAIRHRSYAAFDALVDLITPPIVNLFAFSAFMLVLHLILTLFGSTLPLLTLGWFMVTVCGAIHVFAGMVAARADKDLYKILLDAPRYLFWKLALYVKLLSGRGTQSWVRTTREDSERTAPVSR